MKTWINKCHFGDVRDVLRQMIADGVQVQTIVTSPPYWGLRSYLPAGHADKAREIGSEPTLREFLDTMVGVFDLCRQVLADDGTMWVNMGDSYATGSTPGFKSKDLLMQPHRLAIALQDAGWWVRQDNVWHKPNPMPESTRDRCTKSHEFIFHLSKSERYYFDQGAISEEVAESTVSRMAQDIDQQAGSDRVPGKTNGPMKAVSRKNSFARTSKDSAGEHGQSAQFRADRDPIAYEGRRNKRSVWTVATESYKGAHFATFPRALIEPCILAGAPAGGVVLDIVMGSGTTAQVAEQLGRQWIGIDIDTRNRALQAERLRQPSLNLEAA